MGQAIYYCGGCSIQLREAQFEAGKAYRLDNLVYCSSCAQEAVRSLPPDQAKRLQAQMAKPEKRAVPVRPPLRDSSRAVPRPAAGPSGLRPWMVAVGAAIGILGILLVILASGRGGAERPREKASGAAAPAPRPPSAEADVSRAESPALEGLRRARRFALEHPEDLEGQIRAFEELAFREDKSEVGEEARKAAEAVRGRQREAAGRAGAALDAELAGPLGRQDWGGALRLIEAAKGRMSGTAAKLAVEKRERDVHDRMVKAMDSLKEKAREAKAKGNRAELDGLVDTVRRWGVASLVADFESSIAAMPDPPPPAVVLDDFERDSKLWAFTNGQEFPGAKGSFAVERSAGRDGKGAGRLQADFTGGGAYVGVWLNFGGRARGEFKEVRLWIKSTEASHYMVRVGDASGQCFQRKFSFAPSPEWQEIVIRFAGYARAEHWGGANDGKVHAPVKGFGIHLVKDGLAGGALRGELWIDDVQGVDAASSP